MKVLLIADTHGSLDPRIARAARDADYVVHAGDVGSPGVLEALCPRVAVVAVRGNVDGPARRGAAAGTALERLAAEARLELPGGLLVAVHGDRHGRPARRHDRLRADYPEARIVVYGHSHRACVDREARPWVVNPGAAGRVRTFGGPSCLVLDAGDGSWRIRLHRHAP